MGAGGTKLPFKHCTFDDVSKCIRGSGSGSGPGGEGGGNDPFILISTLPRTNQECLIANTVPIEQEEALINSMLGLRPSVARKNIVVYGRNWWDESGFKKCAQLSHMGFSVRLYAGGLFEWLCLQDIYGEDVFPTTSSTLDILQYGPSR
jgi:hypothetical protein